MKEGETLKQRIESVSKKFLESSKDIEIISHFDTDGISSATIIVKTLKKLDKKFSLRIVKSITPEFIETLPKNKTILFLDLASGSLEYLKDFENVFILDHHQISQEVPSNIEIVNPELHEKQKISGSGVVYLFCKEIDKENKEYAKLAVLGMIGDCLEKDIDKLNNHILEDGEIQKKRGLLIYPSTRPLNRTLEFSSNPYIPEVTGNIKGVLELLRESGLSPKNGKYKSLIELTEEEMEKLTTNIMIRNPKSKDEIIGDIFLIKLFNKLEDARELSAKINACSRLGYPEIALQLCMEIPKAEKKSDTIYAKYKQEIIHALRYAEETEKIQGEGYVIIHGKDQIKDTMAGTVASMLSNSPKYEPGTIIITMAYYEDKTKISARIVRQGRNLKEMLQNVMRNLPGEIGGHEKAAGAIISQEKEEEFIETLKKQLEIQVVKVNNKNNLN